MHPTSAFHWKDRRAMLAFVQRRSFVTLVDERLQVAQAPVIVDEPENRLLLHLSRGNALLRSMPARVVAIVSGADGYVSPDWYAEQDQVPTWNYETVEIVGTLALADDALLLAILTRLSEEHEARIPDKSPWTMDKLSDAKRHKLLGGIVGATLSIDSLRGTQKLSQNKSQGDTDGVIAALEKSPSPHDHELASRMMLLRKQSE